MPEKKPSLYDYQEDLAAAGDLIDEEASLHERALRSERRAEVAEAESRIDSRTGLYNERAFADHVAWLESFGRHNPGTAIRVDFIDLRNLGDFNNDFSPEAGNQALRETADALRAIYRREGDFIARWGGDEFAVIRVNNDPKENVIGQVHHELNGRSVAGRPLDAYIGTAHWTPDGPHSRPTLAEVVAEAAKKQSDAKRRRKHSS